MIVVRRVVCVIAIALLCPWARAASPAPVGGERGMVVTAQHLATRVGVDVLRDGGNAVDAAVAVGYALAVVYPAAGNLGGGGFMTLVTADGQRRVIDFRETAPRRATAAMYFDAAGQPRPRAATRGHLAVAVPGTVSGLELARERFGTMRREALVAPAQRLAEQGFVLDDGDIVMLATATEDFRRDPASAAIFLKPGGAPLAAGDRLVQPDLARTLARIAEHGAAGFYRGPVAEAIAAASAAGGGVIGTDDLAGYRAVERAPLECDYRGLRVVSVPPPSGGGVAICEILGVLEGVPLASLGFRSAEAVHWQIEAMRHAYVDRNAFLGDPAFVTNPLAALLAPSHAARLRAAIDPQRAGVSAALRAGVAPHDVAVPLDRTAPREGEHTTHYSIVVRFGNAVAVTYTLNDWFGARVTAGGTGVLLNDEMDDFSIQPGSANHFGLVQGEANAIAPGKRPLSSMSPTIVLKDGKPWLVAGTPGGSRIITVVVHLILNLVDYRMTLQEAVDAPRFHHQWLPDVTYLERFALSPDTLRLLEQRGHRFGPPQSPNHAAAILVGAPGLDAKPIGRARVYGANDPRRGTGLALGD